MEQSPFASDLMEANLVNCTTGNRRKKGQTSEAMIESGVGAVSALSALTM